jgi:hypothetical protein
MLLPKPDGERDGEVNRLRGVSIQNVVGLADTEGRRTLAQCRTQGRGGRPDPETQLHDIVNAPSTGGAEFTRIKNLKDKTRR